MCVQSTEIQNDLRNSMMLNGNKHQHDLFSGSLGIPDVNTHVGSVVHAFELMSRSRGASPTGPEVHSSQQRNSDIIPASSEQPYELHTISNSVDNGANDDAKMSGGGVDKRQQAYRKSDGNMNFMAHMPAQQIMKDRVHRFIDIPTPPPPPTVMAANLPPLSPLPQEIDDEPVRDLVMAGPSRNFPNKSYFEKTTVQYNKLKAPRAHGNSTAGDGNEMSDQFMPASQIIRMNENVQKTRSGGVKSGEKRSVGIVRGKTLDDTDATTMQYGNKPKDSFSSSDQRRKLFGSQPNIIDYKVFNPSTAIPANLNSAIFQTNYANIDFRENFDQPLPRSKRFSQQHTHRRYSKNDNNNYNADQLYYEPHQTADIFSAPMADSLGNRFLNRTNQINNNNRNSNSNSSNVKNSNNSRNSNANETTDNWMYQNSVDDQMLLRGTTVSQSFIKSMKNAERHKAFKYSTQNSGSTSNGFKRGEMLKSTAPTAKRPTRSYYRPQKYILHDDDDDDNDYGDELRTRYTEHSSSATLASTKPLARNFKLSKNGYHSAYRQAKPV